MYSSARYSPPTSPNERGMPGDAAEPRVDRLLAAQQRAPQAAERPAAMRLS